MVRAAAQLTVSPRIALRRKRLLPLQGEVLTQQGAVLEIDDIVAIAMIPGPLIRLNAAQQLGVTPRELKSMLRLSEGDAVSEGQLIAKKDSPLRFLSREVLSPASGVVESISFVTGYALVQTAPTQLQLRAYLPGKVAEVIPQQGVIIEAEVAQIQGIFGLGRETQGRLFILSAEEAAALSADRFTSDIKDAVVVCAGKIGLAVFRQMQERGVRAVVAASASGEELNQIAGQKLNLASTGNEDIGLTIVLTEGFGQLTMAEATFDLFRQLSGKRVSVSGATQIRAGVIRPEILSLPCSGELRPSCDNTFKVGSRVRIARGPAFGAFGSIIDVPAQPCPLLRGGSALVVEVELDSGRQEIVPRANIELLA